MEGTYFENIILPPALLVFHTTLGPPIAKVLIITIAITDINITIICSVSVQTTAFNPPYNIYYNVIF